MKYVCLLLLLLVFQLSLFAQTTADVIIKNGRVLDGTGNSWIKADIAVKDGKIIKLGSVNGITASNIIDARGLIVAPGFIDVHTHIEGDDFKNPTADNFILDGLFKWDDFFFSHIFT